MRNSEAYETLLTYLDHEDDYLEEGVYEALHTALDSLEDPYTSFLKSRAVWWLQDYCGYMEDEITDDLIDNVIRIVEKDHAIIQISEREVEETLVTHMDELRSFG